MHQPNFLGKSRSTLLRAFLMCVLFLGSQFTLMTGVAVAQAGTRGVQPHKIAAVTPAHAKLAHKLMKSAKQLKVAAKKGLSPDGKKLGLGPDLGISILPSSPAYNVGDTVTYTLTVQNSGTADPILAGPITVTDLVALGLTNITATANPSTAWSVSVPSTTSPTLITASYTGGYPVATGATLPSITVTGTATDQALGLLANVGAVTVLGDLNLGNNTAVVDVQILGVGTPTPVVGTTTPVTGTTTPVTGTTTPVTGTTTPVTGTTTPITGTTTPVTGTTTPITGTTTPVTGTTTPVTGTTTPVTGTTTPITGTTTPVTGTTTPITGTTTPVVPLLPNLSVSNTPQGGSSYTVGQTVTFDVVVSNDAAAAPENVPNSIVVTDIAPLGLTGISGSGTGWTVVINAAAAHPAVGPAELVATYTGSYPILPGATLPPLLITGTLTADAVPSLTNTAVLTVFNNGGTNTAASATITVSPSTGTPGAGTPGAGTPGAGTPGAGTPGAGTPGAGTPGAGTPGAGTPGAGTPGAGTPGAGTPGAGTPGAGTPGAGTPGTGTPTTLPPSLSITKVNLGGDNFVVGQTITYQLVVTDNVTSGPVVAPNPITVTDIAPVGLVGMSASSVSAWTLSLSTTTSPAVMTATYNGAYPVMPGTVMPPITITGIFAPSAVPSFTNTAAVTSPGDPSISNGDIATDTVFVSPEITGTTTPVTGTTTPVTGTTTPGTGSPDLSIVKTNLHSDDFNVGDQVTYVLVVSDLPGAGSVASPNPITVSDAIPLGESNLQADGQGWSFTYSNQSGPAIITATYTGSYPVAAGTTMPSITITATLTSDAIPSVTDTATVDTLGNLGTYNTATDTVYVYQQNQCLSSGDDQNGSIAGFGSVSATPTIPATETVLGTETVPATDTTSATDTVPTDTVPATETVPGSSDGSSDPNSYSDQGNNGDCGNNGNNGNNGDNGNNGNNGDNGNNHNNGNNNNQNDQNNQGNFNFNHDNSNNHNNSSNNNNHSNYPALPLTGSDPELQNQ